MIRQPHTVECESMLQNVAASAALYLFQSIFTGVTTEARVRQTSQQDHRPDHRGLGRVSKRVLSGWTAKALVAGRAVRVAYSAVSR